MKNRFINTIIGDPRGCDLVIPSFQRRYTWGRQQQTELARSILEGVPAGTVVIWRKGVTGYVIDGQQRLLTLAALYDGRLEMWVDLNTGMLTESASDTAISFQDLTSTGFGRLLRSRQLSPAQEAMALDLRDRVREFTLAAVVCEGDAAYIRRVFRALNTRHGIRVELDTEILRGEPISLDDAARGVDNRIR